MRLTGISSSNSNLTSSLVGRPPLLSTCGRWRSRSSSTSCGQRCCTDRGAPARAWYSLCPRWRRDVRADGAPLAAGKSPSRVYLRDRHRVAGPARRRRAGACLGPMVALRPRRAAAYRHGPHRAGSPLSRRSSASTPARTIQTLLYRGGFRPRRRQHGR